MSLPFGVFVRRDFSERQEKSEEKFWIVFTYLYLCTRILRVRVCSRSAESKCTWGDVWQDVETQDYYQSMDTYKFEGD